MLQTDYPRDLEPEGAGGFEYVRVCIMLRECTGRGNRSSACFLLREVGIEGLLNEYEVQFVVRLALNGLKVRSNEGNGLFDEFSERELLSEGEQVDGVVHGVAHRYDLRGECLESLDTVSVGSAKNLNHLI